MANQVETIAGSTPITCPADKFYHFFKYSCNDIIKIFPAGFTGVKVLEGEEGVAGTVKLWNYIVGGIAMTAKVTTAVIDDATKTIKYVVSEGEVMLLYKTFNVILTVSEGSAKWSFEYEKATLLSPPPQLYVTLFVTLAALVDAYLLIN